MPTYEYRCEANDRVIEVRHNMAERLATWGELCQRAGISPGRTDPASPVEKLISAGFVHSGAGSGEPACAAPACGSGFCGSGACGLGE